MTHDLRLDVATTDDVAHVIDVLDEAAEWLLQQGIDQWPRRFRHDVVLPAIEAGETFLVMVDGDLAGTITVDATDPAWIDLPARALYVHRLAVRRRFAGIGAEALAWVEQRAASDERLVRLDCVAANQALCRYYVQLGYAERGEVHVGGAPGQRVQGTSSATAVLRFEKSPTARYRVL